MKPRSGPYRIPFRIEDGQPRFSAAVMSWVSTEVSKTPIRKPSANGRGWPNTMLYMTGA
jgi:hypothetical protein